jgi:hypothetical protein
MEIFKRLILAGACHLGFLSAAHAALVTSPEVSVTQFCALSEYGGGDVAFHVSVSN